MPWNMRKPYATSTICHVVEAIAMLGIHWKVFNRSENRYRAQGNVNIWSVGNTTADAVATTDRADNIVSPPKLARAH
ncbi:hypothetical protein EDB81DRAFT_897212 [Dactylonectria macrodidyma]|uniref:Uncharacterized protein n=1 Tax=Dactylonectria macrodidyma TaxID=307937 RepID=A0A9P9JRC7_9HYPO|nr:hypothetical protein EDB81DRAFT_897212 [Dactylonectria macrodidyma]